VNTVAARLANEVGTGNVAATARRLGIRSPIQLDPSMALGAVEVSPVELAQAYAPFANGGFLAPAWAIERVRTAGGKVLYDRSVARPARTQVIGSPALPQMKQMMRQVIASGTGTRARVAGYDLAGKTGTTSDYRDAWFVGYTGGFVAAVWLGRDDNTPMRRVTGGGAPAGVWQGFMSRSLPRLKAEPIPGGLAPPASGEDPIGDLLDAPALPPAGPDAEQVPAPGQAPVQAPAPPSPQAAPAAVTPAQAPGPPTA
jgi:penicillin-binding protein 1A